MGSNMEEQISVHECKALKMSARSHGISEFGVISSALDDRHLLPWLSGGSLKLDPPQDTSGNWLRITENGWRCMYGETLWKYSRNRPAVKAYPFIVWKWPADPNGARRSYNAACRFDGQCAAPTPIGTARCLSAHAWPL